MPVVDHIRYEVACERPENATLLTSIEIGSLSAAARQLKAPLPTVRKVFGLESCGRSCSTGRAARTNPRNDLPKLDAMIHYAPRLRAGRHFALSTPAILLTDHAAPCRKTLSRMLIHPVGELRCAHQAGLHRDVSEVRGGDSLLAAICRRRQTAEHGDDRDHDRPPSP